MEGSCSTGQSPQWAVVPVEEEEGFQALSPFTINKDSVKMIMSVEQYWNNTGKG
jgi:hypothetical protein